MILLISYLIKENLPNSGGFLLEYLLFEMNRQYSSSLKRKSSWVG